MANPLLDFANPLFSFGVGSTTYTATKDCYVCGMINPSNLASGTKQNLLINNTVVAFARNSIEYARYIPPIKISAGDVVEVSPFGEQGANGSMKVYSAK